MSTIYADTASRFDQIRAEVADVLRRREELFVTTHAELVAAGIDSTVITSSWVKVAEGDHVILWEEYRLSSSGRVWMSRSITPHWNDYRQRHNDQLGPYDRGGQISISRGVHEVLVCEDKTLLLGKIEHDEERAHQRAIARLRNRAGCDHFRVRVRDRDVTLISPMNDVVHQGDVNSAYLWLAGIDTSAVEVPA